jgi:hypothetical protein
MRQLLGMHHHGVRDGGVAIGKNAGGPLQVVARALDEPAGQLAVESDTGRHHTDEHGTGNHRQEGPIEGNVSGRGRRRHGRLVRRWGISRWAEADG